MNLISKTREKQAKFSKSCPNSPKKYGIHKQIEKEVTWNSIFLIFNLKSFFWKMYRKDNEVWIEVGYNKKT